MEQAVYETLKNATSSDGSIRAAAEQKLKELAVIPEYPVCLAQLTICQDVDIPFRQFAAVALKLYIPTHWSARDDEKFIGPMTPDESKARVRETIVRGLADPSSKIRVVSAAVVSKIAHNDFPEDWPGLLDNLLLCLKSKQADSTHGAMRVLSEMFNTDISVAQVPQIAPVLLPQLYAILSDGSYSFHTRGRVVNIIKCCVDMQSSLREEDPTLADKFIGEHMPQWMTTFREILTHHVQGDLEKATEEYGLKMDVIKCICSLSDQFPKFISEALPTLYEPIWNELCSLRERYVNEHVSDTGEVAESFQDSDANEIGFQPLLFMLFDFITASCNKKTVRHIFVKDGDITSFFQELLYVSIIFMQITNEQEEVWSSDANQYVADEEESTFTFNARVAAVDIFITLQETYPALFFKALSAAVERHIRESNEMRAANNGNWWKIQEACLLALGRLSDELTEALQNDPPTVNFDLKGLFDHVILEGMKSAAFPFLQGRAFVFASEFARSLPAEMAGQYVAVAVNALQSPESSVPVKISALRALNNYCKFLEPQHVTPSQVNIMEGTCQLLPLATEESLMLLLDTLCLAIKINGEVSAKYEHVLTPAVVEIWKRFPSDPIINSCIIDIFEECAKDPHYHPALCSRMIPILTEVFTTSDVNSDVNASALDILTAIVGFGPQPLPADLTEKTFPALMNLALNTQNVDVLQSSQECLKKFISKDCEHIVQWRDSQGKSGLDYTIHFVAKLLEPATSSSDALFVGDLIVNLIQKAGPVISGVLPSLLTAVLVRLDNSENTSNQRFTQSLVLVFAHLIVTQQDTVIQFLSTANINGKNGLELLMNTWCDDYNSFSGFYPLKVSAVAMSQLFNSSDPRLQAISVKGDIVVNPNSGIVTRSRSKKNPDQYTSIPLPVKMIKLLIADAINCLSAGRDDLVEDAQSMSDDDGEWEDVNEVKYLSELMDELANEEDDEEYDIDRKDDPVYKMDMKEFFINFFHNCKAHNVNHFAEICTHHLNEDERNTALEIAAADIERNPGA